MSIDHYGEEPFYRQLAALLLAQIEIGEYAPGDQLPSEKALEQQHGVSRGTVRAAYKVLRDQGHVIIRAGRGVYVPPET